MTNIFISYSTKDRKFVEQLSEDLVERFAKEEFPEGGLQLFYDRSLQPGDSWAESLNKALAQADVILLVLSPSYFDSAWAKKEMQIALFRAASGESVRVIPLVARPCRPPDDLQRIQWVDFTDDYQAGLDRLIWGISGTKPIAAEGPAPGDAESIAPDELRRLRDELREAIDSFRARPSEHLPQVSSNQDNKRAQKCFVVMPFGNVDLEVVYEDFVKPVIEKDCGLLCQRGDDVFGSNVVMDDIVSSIQDSDVILADLTGKNANVFYEVGICHAVGKKVLLLAQSIDDVPFDLRHWRVLLYDYSPHGCKKLERTLKENLFAVLESQ